MEKKKEQQPTTQPKVVDDNTSQQPQATTTASEEMPNPKYSIYQKLGLIQAELKAPKNQRNKFGNYNYRSAEDILEAVKPIALKYGAVIKIHDEIVMVGDRIYVKANVSLINVDEGKEYEQIQTQAFAREEESKKGMDGSQVTGASSSYARKYALNGMFCIDDTKDSDATNDHGNGGNQQPKPSTQSNAPKPQDETKVMYRKVWAEFCKHPANEGLSLDELKQGFNSIRIATIGEQKKSINYTTQDWEKLLSAIKSIDPSGCPI